MWIRLKCRAGWLLRLKFSVNLLAEIVSLHQDDGGRSVSSPRQHREGHIWAEPESSRQLSAGQGGWVCHTAFLEVFVLQELFSCRVFYKSWEHCSEQHSSVACFCVILGAEQSFLCPTEAGGVPLFFQVFSAPFRARGVFLLRLCWMLPWCHAVSQQGVLLWRLPSFSVIASSSSFSLSKNGLEHSLYIPNVTNAESTSPFFFFFFLIFSFHIHFALWEVLDQELRYECTWAVLGAAQTHQEDNPVFLVCQNPCWKCKISSCNWRLECRDTRSQEYSVLYSCSDFSTWKLVKIEDSTTGTSFVL